MGEKGVVVCTVARWVGGGGEQRKSKGFVNKLALPKWEQHTCQKKKMAGADETTSATLVVVVDAVIDITVVVNVVLNVVGLVLAVAVLVVVVVECVVAKLVVTVILVAVLFLDCCGCIRYCCCYCCIDNVLPAVIMILSLLY